jgi:hypothetical protein
VDGVSVTGITISGTGFSTLDADGGVVDEILLSSDPEAASVLLSEVFGELPDVAAVEETHCAPSFIRSSWGGALTFATDYVWSPEGQQFSIAGKTPCDGVEHDSTMGA